MTTNNDDPIELSAIILTRSNTVIGFSSIDAARDWMTSNPAGWEVVSTAPAWAREAVRNVAPVPTREAASP